MNTRRSGRGNGDCVVDDDVLDDVVVDDDVLDDVVAGEVLDDDGSRAGSDPTSTTGDDDGFSGIPPRACPIRTPASVAHAVTMIAASTTNALRLLTCSPAHTAIPTIAGTVHRADSVSWHATFTRKRTQL